MKKLKSFFVNELPEIRYIKVNKYKKQSTQFTFTIVSYYENRHKYLQIYVYETIKVF